MWRGVSSTIARSRLWPLGLLIAATVCGDASALASGQETSPPVPKEGHGAPAADILVTGNTVAAVDALVESLTRTDADNEAQVARWDRQICPRVLGLAPEQSALVIADIARTAKIAGLSVSRRRCRGDVIVVVTSDADGFATALVKRHPGLFREPGEGLAPRREREALRRSKAPVRWIVSTRTEPVGGPAMEETPSAASTSRLQLTVVKRLSIAISIVDAKRLSGITWQQLSDYLALASLTRADMDVSYGPNTILSLFQATAAGHKAPPGLTALDKAFLKSLYTSPPSLGADAQRLAIRTAIQRNRCEHPTSS